MSWPRPSPVPTAIPWRRPTTSLLDRPCCSSATAEPASWSDGRPFKICSASTSESTTVGQVGNAPVRVGVLGCGNVGAALVELITRDADVIASRTGVRLEVGRVAVRNVAKERAVQLPEGTLTHDAEAVVSDPGIEVVVEVIGGIEPARMLILQALKAGKPVVTANKELLANVGGELFEAAAAAGLDLLYEASVAGGIPLIRPSREALAGA